MELAQNILLVVSLLALVALAAHTATRTKMPGSRELLAMILSFLIWTVGSLMESLSSSFSAMLFWRNFEQIGVFLSPLSTLFFSVAYTMNRPMRVFARVAAAIEALSVLLILTDSSHHIMRQSVEVIQSGIYGNALVVHSTMVGSILVAFNFSLALVAVGLLLVFARSIVPGLRRPIWLILISIALTFAVTLLKATVLEKLGIYLQMSVLSTPCVALLCYAVFWGEFLGLSPIARNKVFDVIEQGILVISAEGTVIDRNSRAAILLQSILPHAVCEIGAKAVELLPERIEGESATPFIRIEEEYEKLNDSGCVLLKWHRLGNAREDTLGYVLVMTDITAQKNYERQLRERAERDMLTGVLNREGLSNAYEQMRKTLAQESMMVSVFLIDVDHFKDINDTHGHLCGDRVLEEFGRLLESVLHREDLVGRIGGDEFMAILPNIGRQEARHVAEKVRQRTQKSHVSLPQGAVSYTVSIGVTDSDRQDMSLEDLLHRADLALYQAKAQGRNCTAIQPN